MTNAIYKKNTTYYTLIHKVCYTQKLTPHMHEEMKEAMNKH